MSFAKMGAAIGELVEEKNKAYGDAVGKTEAILMVLYPNGIKPSQYGDLLLLVRDLDKTIRIACGDKDAFDESPWRDKAGYGVIGAVFAGKGKSVGR